MAIHYTASTLHLQLTHKTQQTSNAILPRHAQTTTSQKKDGSLRKRPAAQSAPKRSGDIWESVEILIENDTAPRVKCLYCNHTFCGGATRIREHLCGK